MELPPPTPAPGRLTRRRVLGGFAAGAAGAAVAATGCRSGGTSGRTGPRTIRYGDDDRQVVDLWLPAPAPAGAASTSSSGTGAGAGTARPPTTAGSDGAGASTGPPEPTAGTTRSGRRGRTVFVLVHGGFWRSSYTRSQMEPLARALVARGFAAWNVEYRPVGDGGGWPRTFVDVAAAVDRLQREARSERLDVERVVSVGHGSGGTMALWSAARRRLPVGQPGADPAVLPAAVVSLAGLNNLASAAFEGLGDGAVETLMGRLPRDDGKDAYALADPAELLPLGVPQLLVHGQNDRVVPLRQTVAYANRAAKAGDDASTLVVPGAAHFDVLDPRRRAWGQILDWVQARLG
ncbi:MAG: alpha/beta hydrolase [Actinobacteria bacterium]|nr:alpha/beta hydrolase [Actinomycetota bacterium]